VLKSTKGFIKKTTNMIQDPTVNQHEHMTFVTISKQSKNHYRHFQLNTNASNS